MIISNIIGGLGNQMFQYAFGRARSLELGVQLKLCTANFKDYKLHQGFELARIFSAAFSMVSEEDFNRMLGWRRFPISQRVLARPLASFLRGKHLIIEPHFAFWPDSASVADDSFLMGYWQSEKYFSPYAQVIRKDFAFATHLSGSNLQLANRIEAVNSVSLHVRRGDYVTDPRTRAIIQVCDLQYYEVAVTRIANDVIAPEFFVFSDDIEWAAANLKLPGPSTFICHNVGNDSYIDMRLMSLCKHHIIANSSFSWWGAWLNPSNNKIVIAPKRWFVDESMATDIYPDKWLQL
jgi:hypothetical protein